jgi:hypothetical protein
MVFMNWLKNSSVLISVMMVTFTSAVSQSAIKQETNIIEISWANDFIFGTDRYFTNGLELKYYAPVISKSPTRYVLLPHKKDELVWHGVTLTQHFFTPGVQSNDIVTYDRPFASYLMLGHRKISTNKVKGIKKQSELQIGLLGKYSGGESIQNGIHEILPTSEPVLGWNNQLNPDLALNYRMKFEYGITRKSMFEIIPVANINLGIPYTNVGAGFKFRVGKLNDYFSDIGVNKSKSWQLYFFSEFEGKYVAYNGTIQGGLFNDHIHVVNDIINWVVKMKSGFVFSKKNFGFEFGQHIISPEFIHGKPHMWGYLTLKIAL